MDSISTGKTTLIPLTQHAGIRVTIQPSITIAQPSALHKLSSIVAILSSKWSQMINTTKIGDIQMFTGLQKRVSLCMILIIQVDTMNIMDIIGDTVITSGDHTDHTAHTDHHTTGVTIVAWNILMRSTTRTMRNMKNIMKENLAILTLTMMITTTAMTHGTENVILNIMSTHTNSCTTVTHQNISTMRVDHTTTDTALTMDMDHLEVMDIPITWNHHGMSMENTAGMDMMLTMSGIIHITQTTLGLRRLAVKLHPTKMHLITMKLIMRYFTMVNLTILTMRQKSLLRKKKRRKSQRNRSHLHLQQHLHLNLSQSQRKKHQRRLNLLRRIRNLRKR